MAQIKQFEEIQAWQDARLLAWNIHTMVHQNKAFQHDFGLNNQIRRAAGSIMHNIAEGFDSGSNTEFIRFLRYSRRSASEVQSQLYHALDLKYITQEQFDPSYQLADRIKKRINAYISYLRKSTR